MFTEEQNRALAAPLSTVNVRKNPRGFDYVEGWHMIAEANRIFGFDGWSRETVSFSCVTEKEREVGRDKAHGWGVTYVAKVRVTVGTLTREGCGTGHGIDRDLGQAHESAIKEAETDAMKRALMTFGNPFGLALYDKDKANVVDEAPRLSAPANAALDSQALVSDLIREVRGQVKIRDLEAWGASVKDKIGALLPADAERIRNEYAAQMKALKSAEVIAA